MHNISWARKDSEALWTESTKDLVQKDFSWSKHLPWGSPSSQCSSEMGLCDIAVIIGCSLRKWISSVTHKAVVFKILKII